MDEWNKEVAPITDEEVRDRVLSAYPNRGVADCIIGIYEVRRRMGMNILDAYIYALSCYLSHSTDSTIAASGKASMERIAELHCGR